MIDFEHVSKEYKKGGRLALEDINLHVDDGEFVFLLGHSGAGKSTLLKLILREELPTSGKVTVLGKDVAHLRRRKVRSRLSQNSYFTKIAISGCAASRNRRALRGVSIGR